MAPKDGPYKEVKEHATAAYKELDKNFAAEKIRALKAKRLEVKERTEKGNILVSSQVASPLPENPPPTVNRLDPINLEEFGIRNRKHLLGKLSKSQEPNNPIVVKNDVNISVKDENQDQYNDIFTNEEFLAAYDSFDQLDVLVAAGKVMSSKQQEEYKTLKEKITALLTQHGLTFDSPEFVKFRENRRRDKFNTLISDPNSEIYPLITELEELYSKKELNAAETARLAEVEKQLSDYLSSQGLQFNKDAFKEYFKEQKKIAIYKEIDKLKETDPQLYYWAYAQLSEIDKALKDPDPSKRITEEEAETLSNEVLQRVIKASNDKKLKGMWNDYTGKEEKNTASVTATTSNAIDVASKNTVFSESGLVLTTSGFGDGCIIEMSDSTNFSCEVSVKKDEKGGYLYTIQDPEFANKGVDGPYTAEELAEAVDSRHMDVYLTKELRKAGLDEAGDIGDTPDAEIISICKSLIGSGKERGYKIEGTDLNVIRGLIEVLKQNDQQYSTTGRKIYALSLFLRGEDRNRVLKVRSACLPTDVEKPIPSVSSIIGIKLEDLEKESVKK